VGGGGSGGKGDAKILRELFEGSGVRGAIDHAKVEGGWAGVQAGWVTRVACCRWRLCCLKWPGTG
jgi:hypothetical protein